MLRPVSYTHLDVYKRQELCRLPVTAAYTVDARPVAGYKDQAKRWFMKLLRELLR